jgi:D-amino peptidase
MHQPIKIGTQIVNKTDDGEGLVIPTITPQSNPQKSENMISIISLKSKKIITLNQSDFDRQYKIINKELPTKSIVIMVDMEGITGVPNQWEAVTPAEETGGVRTPIYKASCKAMTLDAKMALAGARGAGANIVVSDSHWNDTNLLDEDFDVKVLRGSQASIKAMKDADGTMLIGWHGKAGSPNACLAHTYTERVKSLKIDGIEVGEVGMLARLASAQQTPVILVTGDKIACNEVLNDFNCPTVGTKFMTVQGVLLHRHPYEIWSEIIMNAYQSVMDLHESQTQKHVFKIPSCEPGIFEVTIHDKYLVEGNSDAEIIGEGVYRINVYHLFN